MQMLKFIEIIFIISLVPILVSAQSSISSLKKRVDEIKNYQLKINMIEGEIESNAGFEECFHHAGESLYVYEYYDNKDELLFEIFIFDEDKPVYYKILKTRDYYNRTQESLFIYECYLSEGKIVELVSQGELPNNLTYDNIFHKSEVIIKNYHAIYKKQASGVPPQE